MIYLPAGLITAGLLLVLVDTRIPRSRGGS